MQYKPTQIFNWLDATQCELNAHVHKVSRQRIWAVIRTHYNLGNFALIERIEKAIALAKATSKSAKAKMDLEAALHELAELNACDAITHVTPCVGAEIGIDGRCA